MKLTSEERYQIASNHFESIEGFNNLPLKVQELMKASFVLGMTQMNILSHQEGILDLEIKIKLNEP